MELVYESGKTKVFRVHLMEGDPIPSFALGEDIKCVVWSNRETAQLWRDELAARLIADRVRYAGLGGVQAEVWHEAVDWAHMGTSPDFDPPDETFVMTDGFGKESLAQLLWESFHVASFDDLWFDQLVLIWVGPLTTEWECIAEHTRRILDEEWIPED